MQSNCIFKKVMHSSRYGWVVVVASFLIQAITGSVGYIQGMLYPEFLRAFEAGNVTTAWVSSIQIAVWFTCGKNLCLNLISTIQMQNNNYKNCCIIRVHNEEKCCIRRVHNVTLILKICVLYTVHVCELQLTPQNCKICAG